jgi:sterol desaturase/sphingolipid hydroxylase (fatty acid hydroxylase superfamily)
MIMLFPWILIFGITAFFFVCERIFPGRELPESPTWYLRALLLNSCQIAIVVLSGILWSRWLPARPLFHFSHPHHSVLEGLMGWFLGTFFFSWWHRARHDSNFLWRVCHQIHHSPARIELLTAFYKHPIEIAADSMLTATILYLILGASVEAGVWYNVFAAFGEYFYHSNIRTPRWVGFFLQRPEHHSIHHQLDLHKFNYGDIALWDQLFGTFREAEDFVLKCGFPDDHEKNLGRMLLFRDSY